MLLCIPSRDDGTLEAPTSPHFGRAPNYSLVETETGHAEVIDNDGHHHGGRRSPPKIVAETGADVLLCSNLGQKAVERFDAMDIEVYCGVEGSVSEAIEQFEADDLEVVTPDGSHCGGHEDHDDGHTHGHDHEHHT